LGHVALAWGVVAPRLGGSWPSLGGVVALAWGGRGPVLTRLGEVRLGEVRLGEARLWRARAPWRKVRTGSDVARPAAPDLAGAAFFAEVRRGPRLRPRPRAVWERGAPARPGTSRAIRRGPRCCRRRRPGGARGLRLRGGVRRAPLTPRAAPALARTFAVTASLLTVARFCAASRPKRLVRFKRAPGLSFLSLIPGPRHRGRPSELQCGRNVQVRLTKTPIHGKTLAGSAYTIG
jgi:hypothetical protein